MAFVKYERSQGGAPEINFRADSGGRIPPKQIIYVRSGGFFSVAGQKMTSIVVIFHRNYWNLVRSAPP